MEDYLPWYLLNKNTNKEINYIKLLYGHLIQIFDCAVLIIQLYVFVVLNTVL
jgi:F0F1-type ATP synthase membrane subunit a